MYEQNASSNNWSGYRIRQIELEAVTQLFAAGENICMVPKDVKNKVNPQKQMCLMNLCRDVIRDHLLVIDPHENLFVRVSKLNLSEDLLEYLLFNISLDERGKDLNMKQETTYFLSDVSEEQTNI